MVTIAMHYCGSLCGYMDIEYPLIRVRRARIVIDRLVLFFFFFFGKMINEHRPDRGIFDVP